MQGRKPMETTTPTKLRVPKKHQAWSVLHLFVSFNSHNYPEKQLLEVETTAQRYSIELDTDPWYPGADAHVCLVETDSLPKQKPRENIPFSALLQ